LTYNENLQPTAQVAMLVPFPIVSFIDALATDAFQAKQTLCRSARAPTLDRIVRWRPLKNAIKLGGLKLAGAILELALEWQTHWKKRPAPGIVVPSQCAYQNTRHATSTS
jgi:hypothetical protein